MSSIDREVRSFTKNSESAPQLGIALPSRKRGCIDFTMSLLGLLPPLNVKIGYLVKKAAEKHVPDGMLPAEARNFLIRQALSKGMDYLFFLDDDVLVPDITLYRMLGQMRKHPEIACITAVGTTKLTPAEPLIYQTGVQGPWWDWQLGALVEIHSAWAGCMLVNLEYVKQMKEPWFNDVVTDETLTDEHNKRNIWGQDRYFHRKLREEAGGLVMADTGLLVGHYDVELQKCYIVPMDAPCFRKPILGESFVTFIDDTGYVNWRRIVPPDEPDQTFISYLDWLRERTPKAPSITMVPEATTPGVVIPPSTSSTPNLVTASNGAVSRAQDKTASVDLADWFEAIKA